jgi:hypothetical protein
MRETQTTQGVPFGWVQIGIVVLTLATALLHLVLGVAWARVPFILNAVGYVVLLAALYLPIEQLQRHRAHLRWVLIAYTILTVVLWVARGEREAIAYADKAIELGLIVLVWLEQRQAGRVRREPRPA